MTKTSPIEIDIFWQNVAESGLLEEGDLSAIRVNWESLPQDNADSASAARWLVKTGKISDLQAEVLIRGHSGPFLLGRYRITEKAPLPNAWAAIDQNTTFPVWLHFFGGSTRADLKWWNEVENKAERFGDAIHPNLLRTYEAVVTRTHRFVATEAPNGVLLSDKMPLKTKLKENQAIELISQISSALLCMRNCGISHGSLILENIVFDSGKSSVQVVPCFKTIDGTAWNSDINALGALLFRFVSGRVVPAPETIVKAGFAKFSEKLMAKGVNESICKLIFDAITCDSQFATCHDQFHSDLQKLAGDPTNFEFRPDPREAPFLKQLAPWKDPPSPIKEQNVRIEATEERLSEGLPKRPQTTRLSVAVSIGVTLVGFAALIAAAAGLASLKQVDRRIIANSEPIAPSKPSDSTNSLMPSEREKQPKKPTLEELLKTQSYVQDIIADDQNTLWESPTTGFPIDVSLLPPSPRMIATVRWRELLQSESGSLNIEALGPYTKSLLPKLEMQLGMRLTEIKSTVHSFHSNLSFDYDAFIIAQCSTPKSLDSCLEQWETPEPVPGVDEVYVNQKGHAYWIAKTNSLGEVVQFATGPTSLVEQVANGEVAVLSGTMRKLVESSDSNRHVNFVFPLISLLNTEGQKLFANQRRALNELRILLPTSVRGALVSLHFEDADYLEIRIEHTSAMKPRKSRHNFTIERKCSLNSSQKRFSELKRTHTGSHYGHVFRQC